MKLFLPTAIICIAGAAALFQSEVGADLTKIRSSETANAEVGVSSIRRVVQSVIVDLAYLSAQGGLIEMLSRGNVPVHEHLQEDWMVFSRTKWIYDQIRLLDTDGQERVRVNFNDGMPAGVPADELQNKGERYYFTDAVKLNRGEFFISPLDLNIERGKIEQPLKPMIRVGTPVFDQDGKKQGIVLLNYLGESMLREFGLMTGAASSRAWLLHREGYWLKGPSAELEWGFMYQRPEASMAHRHPGAWQRILAAEQGQFEDDEGLWTFATVFPLVEGQKTSTGTHAAFSPSRSELERHRYFWKAVLLLPHDAYRAAFWQTGIKLAVATIVILAGLFIGCWRLANAWVQQKEARIEADRANLAKSEFLSSMSHELRTPLNAILGFAQLLEEGRKDPLTERQKGQVRHIRNGGRHLLELINEILDLSRIEAGKLSLSIETVASRDLVDDCLTYARTLARKRNITIEDRTGESMPALWVDHLRSKQALLNLLSNAVKYNCQAGKIFLDAEQPDGRTLRINVTDTGPGIPKDKQSDLFQPFSRLGAETTEIEGTGIGLVLTRKLVEKMGGTVGFRSAPGEGTTFWVDFPIAEEREPEESAEAGEETIAAPTAGSEKRLLLYVEDNPANLALMEDIVAGIPDLTMISTQTAELGLSLAEERSPDVIILDVNLPGMDGIKALRHLQGAVATKDIPVLALSANATPSAIKLGHEAGFRDYLTKPVNISKLMAALQDALEEGT